LDQKNENIPKVSIGLPVYNGKQFIHKCMESLLNQSFTDFELIISDNASTDGTSEICEAYAKKDKRIHYIKQEKNMGILWNFDFVLQNAKNEYFIWVAVDDILLPKFLEKNVNVLENDKSLVGSISKVKTYVLEDNSEKRTSEMGYRKFRKKLIRRFRPSGAHPISGSYEKKVRMFLKKSAYQIIYGMYRTNDLRKSMVKESFIGIGGAIVLNVLRYGDINMIDEVMMNRYDYGSSTKGTISFARLFNKGLLGLIFPHHPLNMWFIKNLGFKLFLKNLDHFIKLNLAGEFFIILEVMNTFIQKLNRRT